MPTDYTAGTDALEAFDAAFPDRGAASEQTVGCPDSGDVPSVELYRFLSGGLRQWDEESGGIFERLLERPDELMARHYQKIWRLTCLFSYKHAPEEALQYLRAHVGFGDGQGAATALAKRLTPAQTRVLIKIAVKFWKSRGKTEALVDAIRYFASGVPPRVVDWRWRLPLVGELAVGAEDTPHTDLLLVQTEHYGAPLDSSLWHAWVRVPDYGSLDRALVEAIVELSRPMRSVYEVAYVDFLDTFRHGRLGHWVSSGALAGSVEEGDSPTDPELLPGMVLVATAGERAKTPVSASWANYLLKAVVKFPGGTAGTSVLHVRFYYTDDDNYYEMKIDTGNALVAYQSRVAAATTGHATASSVDLAVPSTRLVVIEVSPAAGGKNLVRCYIDEILLIESTANGALTMGTIELYLASGDAVRVSMIELFQLPLDTTTLQDT